MRPKRTDRDTLGRRSKLARVVWSRRSVLVQLTRCRITGITKRHGPSAPTALPHHPGLPRNRHLFRSPQPIFRSHLSSLRLHCRAAHPAHRGLESALLSIVRVQRTKVQARHQHLPRRHHLRRVMRSEIVWLFRHLPRAEACGTISRTTAAHRPPAAHRKALPPVHCLRALRPLRPRASMRGLIWAIIAD